MVDIGRVQHRAVDQVRIVLGQPELHRGHVGQRAAHTGQRVRPGTTVQAGQVRRDGRPGLFQHPEVDRAGEPEALGVTHCADVYAEALLPARTAAEGELAATPAGVEHDQRALRYVEPGPRREVVQPALLLTADHFDADPGARADRREHLVGVPGHPQTRRRHRGDLSYVAAP